MKALALGGKCLNVSYLRLFRLQCTRRKWASVLLSRQTDVVITTPSRNVQTIAVV